MHILATRCAAAVQALCWAHGGSASEWQAFLHYCCSGMQSLEADALRQVSAPPAQPSSLYLTHADVPRPSKM